MAELAEHVLLSRSGMTRLIDRLEREGMVTRSTCDKDGRGCYAGLTDLGRATVEQARTTHIEVVRAGFLRHFSEDEMLGLASMFERVLPTT
jgi:DNA-binding MarR family transcriptional regulator